MYGHRRALSAVDRYEMLRFRPWNAFQDEKRNISLRKPG